jgi:uncharacterized protein (DUF779 family)
VLLQAVVQHLPPALLHAATVVGCKGLRPAGDEYPSALIEALHVQYAKLMVLVPVYAGRSEWQLAGLGCLHIRVVPGRCPDYGRC